MSDNIHIDFHLDDGSEIRVRAQETYATLTISDGDDAYSGATLYFRSSAVATEMKQALVALEDKLVDIELRRRA